MKLSVMLVGNKVTDVIIIGCGLYSQLKDILNELGEIRCKFFMYKFSCGLSSIQKYPGEEPMFQRSTFQSPPWSSLPAYSHHPHTNPSLLIISGGHPITNPTHLSVMAIAEAAIWHILHTNTDICV